MMGSAFIAFLGGLHYWWPKMFGRMYNEFWGRIAAVIIFFGFNITFIPQFIMGAQGMPRRYYDYVPRFEPYHLASTIGGYLMAVGFTIIAIYLIRSLFRGNPAPANPWGSPTIEWTCSSPPPYYNFETAPKAGDPYDMTGIEYDEQEGGYVRRTAGERAG